MAVETWEDIRADLERLLDNEARVLTGFELNRLEYIVANVEDRKAAATVAGLLLQNSRLEGELLEIYAGRVGALLGEPVEVHPKHFSPIEERSAWATNPHASTMDPAVQERSLRPNSQPMPKAPATQG
jgi:hypothetical protein